MPELRKRKTPPPAPAKPVKKERKSKDDKSNDDTNATVKDPDASTVEPAQKAAKSGPPATGDVIDFDGFGGDIETHDGQKTTLEKLVKDSKGGVVLFTYPRASTPGCKLPRTLRIQRLQEGIDSQPGQTLIPTL